MKIAAKAARTQLINFHVIRYYCSKKCLSKNRKESCERLIPRFSSALFPFFRETEHYVTCFGCGRRHRECRRVIRGGPFSLWRCHPRGFGYETAWATREATIPNMSHTHVLGLLLPVSMCVKFQPMDKISYLLPTRSPAVIAIAVVVSLLMCGCPRIENYFDKVQSEIERGPAKEKQSREIDAMTHFSYAQILALEGRRGQAIEELLSALDSDPDSAYVRTVLAYNLIEEGRLLEAQGWAEEAVELDPRNAEAYYVLGLVLIERDKLAAAEEKLSRAARLAPDNAEYVIQLADVLLQQGDIDQALLALEDFAKSHPRALMVRYYVAAILRRSGDTDEAASRYRGIIKISSSFYPALYDLMRLEAKRDRPDKAIETGYALIGFFPSDSDSRKLLAKLLINTGREEEALQVLEGGKAVGKPDATWSLRKGFILLDLDRIEQARAEFESALQIEPQSTGAIYGLGLVEMKAGNEMEALSYLESVPPDSNLYLSSRRQIIISALKKGDTEQARTVADDLYSRRSQNLKVIMLYTWTLRHTGDHRRAEQIIKRTLQMFPDREGLWLERALNYTAWGKNDKAVATMQEYLDDHPRSAAALNFIGYTWAEQGIKLDEAEKLIKKALELSPDSGYIMDSLGWVYFQKGDYEKALKWLNKAYKAAGADSEILLHLGDCYRAMNETSKSREFYKRALEEAVSPSLRAKIKGRLEDVR